MSSLQAHLPSKLIRALYGISREKNPQIRARVLEASLKEVLRWFTLTARQLLQGVIDIPHQTKSFFERNKVALTQLADPRTDTGTKKQIILKPGGSGSLGGVIIRSLLKWNPNAPQRHVKATKKKTKKKKTQVTPSVRQRKKRGRQTRSRQVTRQKRSQKKKSRNKKRRQPYKKGTSARTRQYTRKPPLTPPRPTLTAVAASPRTSIASTPPMLVMPPKPNLTQVFPNLMKHWTSTSSKASTTTTPTRTPTPSSSLATMAASNKVPTPKVKVQERSGMLQSLLDLSKQELVQNASLKSPTRRGLPVIKLARGKENRMRRIPL